MPLYLRIWLAVVGAVAVMALAFAWLWQANLDEAPGGPRAREREIILRDEAGQVIGRTRSRPVFVPGHGAEFTVPLEDGRTITLHIPPRERRGDDSQAERPRPDEATGPASTEEPRPPHFAGGPGPRHMGMGMGPPPPSRPWLRGTSGLLWMLAAVALAVALGSYPIIRRLTQRLESLRSGVDRWGEGDLRARVDESGGDEVAALARRFNHAATRVEQLVQSHKSLLANASHELRSPLARIRMALALLGPQSASAARDEITRSITELDQLVEEILLASRLDTPDADIGPREPVDLTGLAAEECARSGAQLQVGDGDAVVMVQGQPRLLRRVLRNLLENAGRHGAGEVVVEVGLETGLEMGSSEGLPSHEGHVQERRAGDAPPRREAVVRVRDRGPGVPPAERTRIFEPFYRLPGASEHSGGVGLGLALVRSIVQRHGGQVRCEDNPGGGACFVVRLPLGADTPR